MIGRDPYLWKHRNGIYYVIFYDNKGRKRQRSLKTRDKRKATILLNHFKREYYSEKLICLERPSRKLLGEFIKEFLIYMESLVEPSTLREYHKALLKLEDYFGQNICLSDISRRSIDMFISTLGKNISNSTANKILRHLKASFNKALEWDYISENPFREVVRLKENRNVPRFIREEEFQMLLTAIDDKEFRCLVNLALLTGLRRSDLLSLKWEDVDFDTERLIVEDKKTHQRRVVPITVPIKQVLEELKGLRRNSKYLFRWRSGDHVSHLFKQAVRKAKLRDDIHFHCLRHTFCSYLVNEGVDIRTVQVLAGHRSIASTLVYSHVRDEHLRRELSKLRLPLSNIKGQKK